MWRDEGGGQLREQQGKHENRADEFLGGVRTFARGSGPREGEVGWPVRVGCVPVGFAIA